MKSFSLQQTVSKLLFAFLLFIITGCSNQSGKAKKIEKNKTEYPQEVLNYIKSANAGDADAQNTLAIMYQSGKGIERNYSKAVKWYKRAINNGNIIASYNLANLYRKGIGIKQDLKMAVKYFTLAAEKGDAMSRYNLSLMYYNGDGVNKNYKKSFLLFIHIILGGLLTFLTLLAMNDYTKNILSGLLVSIIILFFYFILLKKSAFFFNQGEVGIAYFLAIGGFFSLLFAQLVNCSNSIISYLH